MNLDEHPLMRAVTASIARVDRTAPVLVGVSGGADSVALLRALERRRRRDGRRLVAAHMDHVLRERSSDDADWVRQLAESLQAEYIGGREDVCAFAAARRIGIEEAARRCRYAFLARSARQCGASSIAVAHTADDQAETLLHHLLRGTGLPGLRGMPAERDLEGMRLIRPLLSVSREEVLDFLERCGQPFLRDETNEDPSYTRNRIRHTLLPLLKAEFNPQVVKALCRLSLQAGEAQSVVEELAGELLEASLRECSADEVALETRLLRPAQRLVVRELLRLVFLRQDWPRQQMGFEDWERLAELAQSAQVPKSLSLPGGIEAHYRRGMLRIGLRVEG
jgi:tRNA(Ile)-lysidine synthase